LLSFHCALATFLPGGTSGQMYVIEAAKDTCCWLLIALSCEKVWNVSSGWKASR
jgi:hypothetical protein